MRFELDDEQYEFADVVADLLTVHCAPDDVRGTGADPARMDGLFDALAKVELPRLTMSTVHGGSGLASADCALVVEHLGRWLAPDPIAEGLIVAAPLVERYGSDAGLLERLATPGAVSFQDGWGGWAPWAAESELVFVVLADSVIVVAPRPGDVAVLDSAIDPSRRIGRVVSDAPVVAVLSDQAAAVEARRRLAAVTAVCLTGVAFGLIDAAIEYAKNRRQFGRLIGSFQAVKHQLAEAYVEVESSRRVGWWALLAIDDDGADVAEAVALAKATIGDAARKASYVALQVHGGIGYTSECDLHLWMKRVQALGAVWGSADEHWLALQCAYL